MIAPAVQPVPSSPRPRPLWPLVALAIVGLDSLGLYAYLGQRRYLQSPIWIYLSLYAALFGLYVYAAGRLVPRLPRAFAGWLVPLILLLGIAFRLAVLPAPPSLSTDIYLYVWDGRLIAHGINPYQWTPNADALGPFRDAFWSRTEYRSYYAIYMPVSQAVFAVGFALFREDLIGWKAMYALFDCGVIALLMILLRRQGQPPTQIIWYAWCPLPVTEIALAGHQDVVGVFFLLLAFILAASPRMRMVAAFALAAAALTKGFALLLLPLFCRTFGRRFTLASGLALLLLGVPLWLCLPEFLHGMQQYLRFVHVNAGLFQAVNALLTPVTRAHSSLAIYFGDALIVAVTIWSARRPATDFSDLLRRAFAVLAVTLLVVPTLFPWYLLWILPFMALLGHRPSWAFVLLVGTISLVYTYYIHMRAFWWTPLAEYLPFWAALAWERTQWRRQTPGAGGSRTEEIVAPPQAAPSSPVSRKSRWRPKRRRRPSPASLAQHGG